LELKVGAEDVSIVVDATEEWVEGGLRGLRG